MDKMDNELPEKIILAAFDQEDSVVYAHQGDQYINEQDPSKTFPEHELDTVLGNCIEDGRNFLLVYSPDQPTRH